MAGALNAIGPAHSPHPRTASGGEAFGDGIDLALHALAKSQVNATFTLFGDGNCLPGLRRLAQRLGLKDCVDFRGRVPRQQILDLYQEFDVFVFPSLHDTGGYAVLEAMFNQLPCVGV